MTEEEWDACTDAVPMLDFLRTRAAASDRKTRLWACAWGRRLLHLFTDEGQLRNVEVAEQYADGMASEGELLAACADWAWGFSLNPGTRCEPDDLTWVAPDRPAEVAAQADLLRDIFGPFPFRTPRFDPRWRTPLVLSLAQAVYEERIAPDPSRPGWLVLDPARLLVLADALEDAGCDDADILAHCRGPQEHVRGCWVADLMLAKYPVTSTGGPAGVSEAPRLIRFRPSRAEGLPDVREVVVRPDRLEVNTAGEWLTFHFSRIGRRQESRLASFVKRLAGRSPWPLMVAERDWFHPPPERFFLWYTNPRLRTCMPQDEPADHAASYFFRIQLVVQSGGYATFDLG